MSVHAVFDALGVKLSELDDWNCCGGASAKSLSYLLGHALPARNIAIAQQRDLPLAVPCTGCFNAVKRAQYALENDPVMKGKIEEAVGFAYKGNLAIKAIHEVLLEIVGLDDINKAVKTPLNGLKVVSYYGCQLVRNPEIVKMGDYENPTFFDEIVAALGAEAVDWSYKTECCGVDASLTHANVANDRADRICSMAVEAGADCITTSCGLCQINLDMYQTGGNYRKIPVFYLTELMGIAMDVPGRGGWWRKHIVNPKPLLQAKGLF
jgi:heterodisulfide reductase subunit B